MLARSAEFSQEQTFNSINMTKASRMGTDPEEQEIQIYLTADEAVVLFEFVRRFSESDVLKIADKAEAQALWNLCCIFEKGVLASLEGNWPELLEQARNRLRGEGQCVR